MGVCVSYSSRAPPLAVLASKRPRLRGGLSSRPGQTPPTRPPRGCTPIKGSASASRVGLRGTSASDSGAEAQGEAALRRPKGALMPEAYGCSYPPRPICVMTAAHIIMITV